MGKIITGRKGKFIKFKSVDENFNNGTKRRYLMGIVVKNSQVIKVSLAAGNF